MVWYACDSEEQNQSNNLIMSEAPDIPLSEIPGYSEVAEIVAGRPLYHFGGVVSFCYRRRAGEDRNEASTIDLEAKRTSGPDRSLSSPPPCKSRDRRSPLSPPSHC